MALENGGAEPRGMIRIDGWEIARLKIFLGICS
jgi:hypothetical protein